MDIYIITLVIMLIIGIGIPNILASEIASLKPTGNGSMTLSSTPSPTPTSIPTPTITPTPPTSVPLNLSGANTNDRIVVNETIPTIQQLASNNPNMSSIMINFSSASDMEAEYDEERRLSIEITEAESNDEIAEGETESEESEVGEEEDDDGDDDDNENNNDNGNDDANDDAPGLRLPRLPDIDLNLP
jgi:hypothetical protein